MLAPFRCAVAVLLTLVMAPRPADAAELVVWSGGAAKEAINLVIAEFSGATGKQVASDFAPMGALMKRLAAIRPDPMSRCCRRKR